ncbi:MAG: ribonuclease R [Gammaproteobacteria bacterium]
MSKKTRAKAESSRKLVIPERDQIMDLLRKAGRPLTRKQLSESFKISDPDTKRALGRRLKAMTRDGQLIKNRRNAFGLIEKMDLIKGRVIGHPDGYGFVVPDEGGDDLYLSPKEMRSTLHADRVLVRQANVDRQGRREGKLVEVLERAHQQIVGRYYEDSGIAFVVPDNKRISQDILITGGGPSKAKPGHYVVVDLVSQPDKHRQPIGKIIEVLGQGDAVGIAVDIAIRSYDLPYEWPKSVNKEARQFKPVIDAAEVSRRKDLRNLPFVTIDGEDAQDFDDAVYCEKQGNGWRLLVAIADVSHYVIADSALDNEARLRGTSVYFPERVIPMLPEALSNGLCSLRPEEDRLAFVCELSLDANGKMTSHRFYKATICSSARLTYSEMAAMVVDKDETARNQRKPLLKHLDNLHVVYQLLHTERVRKGLIDFSSVESRFVFDENNELETISLVTRNDAHRLIEEMMLAANIAAAEYLEKNEIHALYRVHAKPKLEKLEEVRALLAQLGLTLGGGDKPTAADYASLVEKIRKRDDGEMLEMVLLRSMPLAVYSTVNEGHFGLGFDAYAHFTSPIRRYPDLMVHRAIEHMLQHGNAATYPYTQQTMLELAEHCSMTERRAEEASRDVSQRLKCVFMKDKEGQDFNGMVSSVTAFGLFVVLKDMFVEGLIHISNLPADYYHHDPITHSLRGERSGRKFQMGQDCRVRVTRVDLEERKIDFELLENE